MTLRRSAIVLAVIGTVACSPLGDAAPSVSLWETELVPGRDYPDLRGQAAAVSGPDGTSVGISIEGAEPGAALGWGLWLGTCAAPDRQVGPDSDYPALTVGQSGSAQTETHLAPRLSIENDYHVAVWVSAADPTRLACGDLVAS